jgi:hypothetical protein
MRAVKAQPEERRGYAYEDRELQERPPRNLRPQADDKRDRTSDDQQPADQLAPPDAALFHECLKHFGERATRLTLDFGDGYRNIGRGGGDFVEIADSFLDALFNDRGDMLDDSGRRLLRGRFNRGQLWRWGFGFEARRNHIAASGSDQTCSFLLDKTHYQLVRLGVELALIQKSIELARDHRQIGRPPCA